MPFALSPVSKLQAKKNITSIIPDTASALDLPSGAYRALKTVASRTVSLSVHGHSMPVMLLVCDASPVNILRPIDSFIRVLI